MTILSTLESLRTSLATISGIVSCRIGLEDNITPDMYPLIRLVPSKIEAGNMSNMRPAEVLIYFGLPVQPFDDVADLGGRVALEKVYAALFDLEAAIIGKLNSLGMVYKDTITDEDRLETYKLMAIRCEIEG